MINLFKGEMKWLSNYFGGFYDKAGLYYATNEHWFQANKVLDKAEFEKIRTARTAGEAKRMGKQCELRLDWEDIKVDIMYQGLVMKFQQNDDMRQKLLDTGIQFLVEGNDWGDTFWGVCDGYGLNWLGHLLMRVRFELCEVSKL